MSAPIIGKPPEQKRGAVFGDVPCGGDFMAAGTRHFRLLAPNDCFNALSLATGQYCFVADDVAVTPLTFTPAEPPSDPAVTYGELSPGDWWTWRESTKGRAFLRTDAGFTSSDGEAGCEPTSAAHVRRVSPIEAAAHVLGPDAGASVVVHEEPGTLVRRSMSGSGVVLEGALLGAVKSREWAESLCAQLAALLSTPEPATADPEDDPLVRKLASDPEAMARFNAWRLYHAEQARKAGES